LLVPGASVLLRRIAQKLDVRPDVSMMNTANAMLWHLRRTPAAHVLVATELPDWDAVDLAEIVHLLRPDVDLVLCGPPTPPLLQAAQSPNVELVSSIHDLTRSLRRLRLDTSTPPSPSATQAAPEPPDLDAWVARMASQGHEVLDDDTMGGMERVLHTLSDALHASAVVLSDLAGMTVLKVGRVPRDAEPLYAPMLATLFSTAGEFGRMFDGAPASRLYVQSGARHHLYALAVGDRWVLSVLRLADGGEGRQPVLAAMQRAARELRESGKS
jgi:hypothetical protein